MKEVHKIMSVSKKTKRRALPKKTKVVRRAVKKAPAAKAKVPVKAKPKPKAHGGTRPGSGRKPVLQEPIRRNITLEKAHFDKLLAYTEKKGFGGYSEAVRYLITRYAK